MEERVKKKTFYCKIVWPKLQCSAHSFGSQFLCYPIRRMRRKKNTFLILARDFGFPSIINQCVWHPPFRKRTMASILFAPWTPNHNRRLIDGFSTAQRQHSKSPVRKVPCFSGKTLSLHIHYCISKEFFAMQIAVILQKYPRLAYKVQS